MKDRAGNELSVGDRVLALEPGRSTSWLSWGTVVGFTEKMVRVRFDRSIVGTAVRHPHSVVKPLGACSHKWEYQDDQKVCLGCGTVIKSL